MTIFPGWISFVTRGISPMSDREGTLVKNQTWTPVAQADSFGPQTFHFRTPRLIYPVIQGLYTGRGQYRTRDTSGCLRLLHTPGTIDRCTSGTGNRPPPQSDPVWRVRVYHTSKWVVTESNPRDLTTENLGSFIDFVTSRTRSSTDPGRVSKTRYNRTHL